MKGKPIILIFLTFLLVFSILPTTVNAEWWNTSFLNKRPISINVSGGGTLSDHPVLVNITFDLDMQGDGGDLRLINQTENGVLGAWNQTQINNGWFQVWVNPDIGNDTIFVYYNNADANDIYNGTDVFPFFDGFDGTGIQTGTWETSGSVSVSGSNVTVGTADSHINSVAGFGNNTYESQVRTTGGTGRLFGLFAGAGGGSPLIQIFRNGGAFQATCNNGAGETTGLSSGNTDVQIWRIDRRDDGVIDFYQNGTFAATCVTQIPEGNLDLETSSFGSQSTVTDWIFERPFTPEEIFVSVGAEETFFGLEATITSPENITYYTANVPENITVTNTAGGFHFCEIRHNSILLSNETTNTTVIGVITSEVGDHNVTVHCEDDSGGELDTQQFYSVGQHNFRAINSETSADISTFNINITNGTFSFGNSTTDGIVEAFFEDLPFGDVNITFESTGFNTTTIASNVNSSHNITQINLTASMIPAGLTVNVFDEISLASLIFNITIENATTSFSETNLTSFTAEANGSIPLGSVTITIGDFEGLYGERLYFVTLTELSRITLNAYLIQTAVANFASFGTINIVGGAVPDVLLSAQRTINGSLVTVVQEVTDDSGLAAMWLDPTNTYTIIASRSGFVTQEVSIKPNLAATTFITMATTISLNFSTLFDDISYRFEPFDSGLRTDRGDTNFTFTISSSTGTLENFQMNITASNGSQIFNSVVSGSPSGGAITALIDIAPLTQNITIFGHFQKTGFNFTTLSRTYILFNITESNYTINRIIINLNTNAYGLTENEKALLSIIIIALTSGAVATINVGGGGVAGILVSGLLVQMDWLSGGLFIIMALAVGAVIFIKERI